MIREILHRIWWAWRIFTGLIKSTDGDIDYWSWARNRVFPDGYEPCPFRKCSHRNPCQNSLGWKAGECAAYQEWFANRGKAGERGE